MAAYSFDQLKQILYSAADPLYLQPFFDGAYGNGRELFEQLLSVFQRVDQAIDRTLQALYISPWSGQSAPPASGALHARVALTVSRSRRADVPVTIGAGSVLFEEIANDWGANGGIDAITGRQYTLLADLTFGPGDTTPKVVDAIATKLGYGFANPSPDTIAHLIQIGAGYQNNGASVAQTPQAGRLIASSTPDAFVAEHVGQYVNLTGGANAGAVCRVVGYEPPSGGNGGTLLLANTFVGRSVVVAPVGVFEIGEEVSQIDAAIIPPGNPVIASGVVLSVSSVAPWYVVIETTFGSFRPTAGTIAPILGVLSGATFTVEDVARVDQLLPEAGTASWRILSWPDDLGVGVTNAPGALQIPGSYPILDALGEERGIPRAPGEADDTYRERVATVADLISPNAIRRTGNRIWAPFMATVCLREVGSALFPGMYCDSLPGATSDLGKYAYDLDGLRSRGTTVGTFVEGERVYQDDGTGILATARATATILAAPPGSPVPLVDPGYLEFSLPRGRFRIGLPIVGELSGATHVPGAILYGLRPQDRFKLNLNYTEFRAFFMVGIPPAPFGEFGIPYDAPHPFNAFDAAPYLTFSDGFALTAAVLNRTTWQAIDRARAAGVGFDLYVENLGCILVANRDSTSALDAS